MKTKFLIALFALTVTVVSCGGDNEKTTDNNEVVEQPQVDKEQFLADLNELETRIDNSDGAPQEKDLKKAVTMYQDYVDIFPTNEDAPTYLLKASDFALYVRQPEKSVKLLSRIEQEYPNYNRMQDVMYNKASHLDFELRDTTRAKAAYQAFIDKYPASPMVADAENRIKNIRYSMEELTEMFMKNLEENGSDMQP